MKVYNLLNKLEFLEEVATLEYNEWSDNSEIDRNKRIERKILKMKNNLNNSDFCKLILLDNDNLVGFISIFPNDCEECFNLKHWYATMYVKEEYRGHGYSKILNKAILQEAQKRGYKQLYLKTDLVNYYEKFGAEYIMELNSGEKLYKIVL